MSEKAQRSSSGKPHRPSLSVDALSAAGFTPMGRWLANGDGIALDTEVPRTPAVYAFAVDGQILYVGCASQSLRQRLAGYVQPGPTQGTNQRLNPLIRAILDAGRAVTVFAAAPPPIQWNGLPVNQVVGLEAAIIRTYHLPWNKTGKAREVAIVPAARL